MNMNKDVNFVLGVHETPHNVKIVLFGLPLSAADFQPRGQLKMNGEAYFTKNLQCGRLIEEFDHLGYHHTVHFVVYL